MFDLFKEENFIKFSEGISSPEVFCKRLNYEKFNKDL